MMEGFRILGIAFEGPSVQTATVDFAAGLTTIYGPSDTGKSLLVEVLDFMLGGKGPVRSLPELEGYSRVRLAIKFGTDEPVTLTRALEGGAFRLYEGNWLGSDPESEGRILNQQHMDGNTDSLSGYLLEKLGLLGKRVRKNADGATQSLSFRNLARLIVVTQTEIIQQRSPLSDGNPTADTANAATFQLLITGRDDSDLEEFPRDPDAEASRRAKLELIRELSSDTKQRIRSISGSPSDLEEQLEKLSTTMGDLEVELNSTEAEYRSLSSNRRRLLGELEKIGDRVTEVAALIERFELLEEHYQSDLERLEAIEQAGSLFVVMQEGDCPLCGSPPSAHRKDDDDESAVETTIVAARAEQEKIRPRVIDLRDTLSSLNDELTRLKRSQLNREEKLLVAEQQLEKFIRPGVSKLRREYREFADKSAEVRESLAVYETLEDLEKKRQDLEQQEEQAKRPSVAERLPTKAIGDFERVVEKVLSSWNFPGGGRVRFDTTKKDLVIDGKERQAYGAGLRAVTHAAFTLGLLKFCREREMPHPGFVVIDSALLTYKEPESRESAAIRTDAFKELFFASVQEIAKDSQVVIVDNTTPPQPVIDAPSTIHFTRLVGEGRYGLLAPNGDEGSQPSDELDLS
ncbi:MAG: AAA family ATPase [Pseudomonadota bacterium]